MKRKLVLIFLLIVFGFISGCVDDSHSTENLGEEIVSTIEPLNVNDPPAISLNMSIDFGNPYFGSPGRKYTFTGRCSNPNELNHCSLNLGNGEGVLIINGSGMHALHPKLGKVDTSGEFEIYYSYKDEGGKKIKLTALDKDGGYSTTELDIIIQREVSPGVIVNTDKGWGGRIVAKTITVFGECYDDNHDLTSCILYLGDGTKIDFGPGDSSVSKFEYTHTYNQSGTFEIAVDAADSIRPSPTKWMVIDTRIEDWVQLDFKWDFKGKEYSLSPLLDRETLDYFIEKPRPTFRGKAFLIYATEPKDDEAISALVNILKTIAEQEGFTEKEIADFVIAFTQSMEYTSDDVTTPYDEYPRYPLETLAARGGDCEDTSILAAELLRGLGYETGLILLPGHMAVAIECSLEDHNYKTPFFPTCYLETTGEGWKIGEIPSDYEDIYPGILWLNQSRWSPAGFDVKWSADVLNVQEDYITYQIDVEALNIGEKISDGVEIRWYIRFKVPKAANAMLKIEVDNYVQYPPIDEDIELGSTVRTSLRGRVRRAEGREQQFIIEVHRPDRGGEIGASYGKWYTSY